MKEALGFLVVQGTAPDRLERSVVAFDLVVADTDGVQPWDEPDIAGHLGDRVKERRRLDVAGQLAQFGGVRVNRELTRVLRPRTYDTDPPAKASQWSKALACSAVRGWLRRRTKLHSDTESTPLSADGHGRTGRFASPHCRGSWACPGHCVSISAGAHHPSPPMTILIGRDFATSPLRAFEGQPRCPRLGVALLQSCADNTQSYEQGTFSDKMAAWPPATRSSVTAAFRRLGNTRR